MLLSSGLGLKRSGFQGYVGIRKALKAKPRCAPSKAEVSSGVPRSLLQLLNAAGHWHGRARGWPGGCDNDDDSLSSDLDRTEQPSLAALTRGLLRTVKVVRLECFALA